MVSFLHLLSDLSHLPTLPTPAFFLSHFRKQTGQSTNKQSQIKQNEHTNIEKAKKENAEETFTFTYTHTRISHISELW